MVFPHPCPDLTEVRMHQGVEVLSPAHFFERFKPL
jgi:hypothetical protein